MGALILSLGMEDIPGIVSEQDRARSIYASPLTFCYLLALAVGVNIYAQERRQRSLPMSFLIVPRRVYVALAKYAIGGALGTYFGAVYVIGVLVGGGGMLLTHGQELVVTWDIARALAVMVTLLALWCILGAALGMCFSVVPALLTGFTLALVLPAIVSPVLSSSSWGRLVISLLPGVATNMSTEPVTADFASTWLPWWGSYIALLLWVVSIAVIGIRLVTRSEIDVG